MSRRQFVRRHFDIRKVVFGQERFFRTFAECFENEWRFVSDVLFYRKHDVAHVPPTGRPSDEIGSEPASETGRRICTFWIEGKTLAYRIVRMMKKLPIAVIERRNDIVHCVCRMNFTG